MRRWFGTCILVIMVVFTFGQSNVSVGFLPRVNLAVELSKNLNLNTSVESRHAVFRSLEEDITYDIRLTDFAAILSYRVSTGTSLNGGYQLRLVNNHSLHRFIQQINLISTREPYRFGHRLAFDQTIGPDFPMEFRTRYRFALDRPLNGNRLDPGEFYMKLSNEVLWAIQSGNHDIELRIKPLIGYAFKGSSKLEAGIDYRFNEFTYSASDHDFWFSLTWYSFIKRKTD